MDSDLREKCVGTSLAGLPRFKRGVPWEVRKHLGLLVRRLDPQTADLVLDYGRKTTVRAVDRLPDWILAL
ncbi:hypothetical protein SEA_DANIELLEIGNACE_14 [Arthrobacter phage DanielleIgnace]|nr:hypothetical protein SEA_DANIELLEIGNACE_14 [Arthrobacter phage DanielleIgnace]